MIDKIKRFASRLARKSRTFRMYMNALNVTPSFNNADYKKFVDEAFQQNPYVYSAITQISNSAAGIPPALYRIKEDGEGGKIERSLKQYEKRGHSERKTRQMKRRCIENIRRSVAAKHAREYGAPYHVSKMLATKALVETGELERVDGHEVLDLLQRPNRWYQRSYQQFIQAWVMHLEIGGESFMEPVGPDTRQAPPQQLYLVPPKDVTFRRGNSDAPIRGFSFTGRRDGEYDYSPDPLETEVFYSRYYNPLNPLRGMSPAFAASFSIDVNNEGRRWNLGLLQNGAAHSGIISTEGPFSESQIESIKQKFNRKVAGARNAGKILALDGLEGGKVNFEPVSQTVKDMQWGDMNKMSALEVALVWGMPPEMLGNAEQKTFANYKEARKAFYKEKIIPLMDFIYGDLNANLLPLFGDDNLWLDYDAEQVEALRDDVDKLHERVRKDVQKSVLMINEAREAIGREDIEGGDVILVDSRKVPLSAVQGGGAQPGGQPPPPGGSEGEGEGEGSEGEEGEEGEENSIRTRALDLLYEEDEEKPRFFPNGS